MSVNNILERYNTMASDSQKNKDLFGCALPTLKKGHLVITGRTATREELIAELTAWQQAEGWYQTLRHTSTGIPKPTERVLEGQWSFQGNSLHIQHEYADQYRITLFDTCASLPQRLQCYRDQPIFMRPDLSLEKEAFLVYRMWWQLGEDNSVQGLWQPFAQQFIGFKSMEGGQ